MKKAQKASDTAQSPMPALRQQRQAVMDEREAVVARLLELNAKVESLDSVMTMFDPAHIPIEIRGMRVEAPILNVESRPSTILLEAEVRRTEKAARASVRKSSKKAASPPKPLSADRGGMPEEAEAKPEAKSKTAKSARGGRPARAVREAAAEARSTDNSVAIERLRSYFADVDKLETLKGIIVEHPEGVPLRDIVDGFVSKHPVDLNDARFNKLFRNRISTILNTLSTQGKVVRDVQEQNGKRDGVWKAAPSWRSQDEAAA